MTPERKQALQKIVHAAVVAETATGCPAEISVAQCILESGWLQVAPGNNCFGIKDTDRFPGVQYKITHEFLNGKWETMKPAFEVYPSLEDCFVDHARLITGKSNCYAPAWKKYQEDHNLEEYVRGVAQHYATDPHYFDLIMSIISSDVRAAIEHERDDQKREIPRSDVLNTENKGTGDHHNRKS